MKRDYANGTYMIVTDGPFGGHLRTGRALCVDGVVRAIRASHDGTSDTFFSIPATCTIKGKAVSGFITVNTVSGSSVATDDDPAQVEFVAHQYGKNGRVIDREIVSAERRDGCSIITYVSREFGREVERSTWIGHADYDEIAKRLPTLQQATIIRSWTHWANSEFEAGRRRVHSMVLMGAQHESRHLWFEPGHEMYERAIALIERDLVR